MKKDAARTADGISLGFGIVLMAALGLRLWLAQDLPLWLDESWTGMIATQPDWNSFWREAWLDCNPPFYYVVMAVWTGIMGASDIALRAPSFLFIILAAMVPLVMSAPGVGRKARWAFAVLVALWQPGFEISLDARGYSLLLCLSVVLSGLVQAAERPRVARSCSLI